MSPALWYFSRASGLVSIGLFTAVVVMGCLSAGRYVTSTWPRLTTALLHRNLALVSLVFLALHIGSAIIDGYVALGWLDVVVPFAAGYQPFWVGLGAVAIDLMLAIVITSLVRARISARVWRLVHWLAYLCWPVALVHGVGMVERDQHQGWILAVQLGCVIAVALAVAYRVMARNPDSEARKVTT